MPDGNDARARVNTHVGQWPEPWTNRPDDEGVWGEVQGDEVMVYVDYELMSPELARDLARFLLEAADRAARNV